MRVGNSIVTPAAGCSYPVTHWRYWWYSSEGKLKIEDKLPKRVNGVKKRGNINILKILNFTSLLKITDIIPLSSAEDYNLLFEYTCSISGPTCYVNQWISGAKSKLIDIFYNETSLYTWRKNRIIKHLSDHFIFLYTCRKNHDINPIINLNSNVRVLNMRVGRRTDRFCYPNLLLTQWRCQFLFSL